MQSYDFYYLLFVYSKKICYPLRMHPCLWFKDQTPEKRTDTAETSPTSDPVAQTSVADTNTNNSAAAVEEATDSDDSFEKLDAAEIQ